ncbi:glycoside hydrolase family 76 protein [Spirosoma montaniterrae]|uniref:glycoside hydrolase family 76 protein n=1 Tax=Spirosoma montaniterrae TaxID=1178516 RepID=UPI0009F8569D|nr:glycoside hydrolase family 76 protein [Spirosoma montaniterrae]
MLSAFLIICTLSNCKDPSVGQGALPPTPAYVFGWANIADSSTAVLNTAFWNAGSRYYNTDNRGDTQFQYWPQAHALDVLVDAYQRTSDARYVALMNDWFVGVNRANGNTFLNEYYDDMAWNALAMLRAYDATKDQKWLDATLRVWDDIKTGWNTSQGGGIAWRKGQRDYKNTPSNGPSAILAIRLYQRLKRPDDLAWANRIYDWLKRTLVDEQTGLVYDGINRTGNGQIDLNWKFTYCQGVWIGAGLELYRQTGNAVYLNDALKTANNALSDPGLTTGGLMRDEGEGDGGLFKGILVRYLTLLALEPDAPQTTRSRYVSYLKFNAETLWRNGTTRPALLFGPNWNARVGNRTELKTQLSGAMLMEAMALLKSRNAL